MAEKTEPASEQRLREARLRGEVWRSREVSSAAVFLAVLGALAWCGADLVARLSGLVSTSLAAAPRMSAAPGEVLRASAWWLGLALFPIAAAALLAAIGAGLAQVRPLFTLHPLKPSLARLNPVKNAGRIAGPQALFELAKTLVKVAGATLAAGWVLWDRAPLIAGTAGRSPEVLLRAVGECLAGVALGVVLVTVALSALDLLYQRHSFLRRMRMTKQEVKQEQREGEGDPQHKAARRRAHKDLLEHRQAEAVAEADCVIINPEHLAVAVRFDEEAMSAPRVVARGRRLRAARIKEIARRHGVPVLRNVPLARALVEVELDQEIPAELYEAVAEILRVVYRLAGEGE